MLRKIIQELTPDKDKYQSFSFSYTKNKEYGWINCSLQTDENKYEFTLHSQEYKKETGKYRMLSFPKTDYKYSKDIKIYKDDVKIEVPFVPNIMHDKVLMIFMQLMLSDSVIELDCEDFEEDMFTEEE